MDNHTFVEEYAAKIWKRFPELFIFLGSPELDTLFDLVTPGATQLSIRESVDGKEISCMLKRKARDDSVSDYDDCRTCVPRRAASTRSSSVDSSFWAASSVGSSIDICGDDDVDTGSESHSGGDVEIRRSGGFFVAPAHPVKEMKCVRSGSASTQSTAAPPTTEAEESMPDSLGPWLSKEEPRVMYRSRTTTELQNAAPVGPRLARAHSEELPMLRAMSTSSRLAQRRRFSLSPVQTKPSGREAPAHVAAGESDGSTSTTESEASPESPAMSMSQSISMCSEKSCGRGSFGEAKIDSSSLLLLRSRVGAGRFATAPAVLDASQADWSPGTMIQQMATSRSRSGSLRF